MATSANSSKCENWKRKELWFLVIYAIVFYVIIINRSLQLSRGIYFRPFPLYNIVSVFVFTRTTCLDAVH